MVFSFFSDFYYYSTFPEKKFIITVSLMYGLIAPSLIGFAVWFKAPQCLCQSPDSEEYFRCFEKDFCNKNTDMTIKIDEISSPSISATLGLLCGMKNSLLQSYFLGGILGCLANIFLPIPAHKRKLALVFFGLIQAFANFSVVFTYESTRSLQLSFAAIAFSLMILHANCPLIINEAFVGDLAKAATSVLLMGWGVMGLIYVIFAYFNDADFFRCFTFIGFINLANSLHLIFQNEPDVIEQLAAKKQSVGSLLLDVIKEKNIGFNILAYVLAWTTFAITYNLVNLKLGAIGGNVYLTLLTFSILEVSATFIGSTIVTNYKENLREVIRYIMIFETLLTAAFYFAPFEISDDFPKWKTWILFFLMALVKLGSDLVNNLISVFAQKIFKIRYVKLYLAFSRLSSRLILFKVPVIIIYFEKHGLHPFLFGTMCWMVCSLLAMDVKMPEDEDVVHSEALEKRRKSSKDLGVLVEGMKMEFDNKKRQ